MADYDKFIQDSHSALGVDASYQENAYVNFMRLGSVAYTHKRTRINGEEIDDTELMTNFKKSLLALTDFYAQNVPNNEDALEEGIKTLDKCYENLINHATIYITTRDNIWKKIMFRGQGRARLDMVKKINNQAQLDRARLRKRAKSIMEKYSQNDEINENDLPLWANVLADVRTEKLNIEKGPSSINIYDHTGYGELISGETSVAVIEENRYKTNPYNYGIEQYKIEDHGFISKVGNKIFNKEKEIPLSQEEAVIEFYRTFNLYIQEKELPTLLDFAETGESLKLNKNALAEKFYNWVINNDISPIANTLIRLKHSSYNDEKYIYRDALAHYLQCYYTNLITYIHAPMTDGQCISIRKVLSYRMAELLGLENMVQESKKIDMDIPRDKDNNYNISGVVTEIVDGFTIQNGLATDVFKSRKLTLQVNAAELFDFIIGKTNRNLTDLRLLYQPKGAKNIKLIHNAMSFGPQHYDDILKHKGKESLGTLNIARPLADRISALTDEVIDLIFLDALSTAELKALKSRIHGVQKWLKDNPANIVEEESPDQIRYRQGSYLYQLLAPEY